MIQCSLGIPKGIYPFLPLVIYIIPRHLSVFPLIELVALYHAEKPLLTACPTSPPHYFQ